MLFVVVSRLPLVHAVRWRKINGAFLEVTHDPLGSHLLSKLVVILQLITGVLVECKLNRLLELLLRPVVTLIYTVIEVSEPKDMIKLVQKVDLADGLCEGSET